VEQGKFRLAWIGCSTQRGGHQAHGQAGVDEGYLDNIQLTASDDAPDRCEMWRGRWREKTAVVCNDVRKRSADGALARGGATARLSVDGRVAAAMR